MSEYCGRTTEHTKRRGKIHRCDWCGQEIVIGEAYAKWLYFRDGERHTVYAHKECCEVWMVFAKSDYGLMYSDGDNDRPVKIVTP